MAVVRGAFLARIQRFTDVMLDRLVQVSAGKDADEKEARMLGSVFQHALNTWERALHNCQQAGQKADAGLFAKRVPRAKSEDR